MPEDEIYGAWILDSDGQVVANDSERRIEELIQGFSRVANREGGWTTLFQNPANGTYWELTYPKSELHGGGPRKLARLSVSEVRARYPNIADRTDQG